jgi:hypothetical protein
MHEADFSESDDLLLRRIMECVFRSFIEDGSIIIEGQSPDEIILEYKALTAHMLVTEAELRHTPDHRSVLWRRAKDEYVNGSPEIAITFYALWIEHEVNGDLVAGLQRKGYGLDIINPLIRELKLKTKITALWHIAGFEPLSDADISLIDQVSQARNAFVHYKWSGYNEAAGRSNREQLIRLLERTQGLQAVFNSRESSLLWNGREDEIINFYREDLRRHAEEVGPFTFTSPDREDSAESPPSS